MSRIVDFTFLKTGRASKFRDRLQFQAQPFPPFPHRRIEVTAGSVEREMTRGVISALGGTTISYSASVGQEPIQDRQPTQFSFNTTTGRFFRSGGHSESGNNASNGQ